MSQNKVAVNREIKASRVVLIGSNGAKLGEFLRDDAIRVAEEEGLDLVQVNDGERPVCKIMDYGKYLFEQKKKEKKNPSHSIQLKEIKVNFQSDQAYLDIKSKQARKFLEKGDKVKFTVQFRGREGSHLSLIQEKCFSFFSSLQDVAELESHPKMGDHQVSMILVKK